jgi:bifunctional DNase/RNase
MALVVLKEHARERSLPMWVGVAEGNALALALAAVAPPRPMTHDLMARLVEACQSQVEKVAVTMVQDKTYYATLWVRVGGQVTEVDARPSDALSLAVRVHVPIFVASDLFAQHSLPLERMLPDMEAHYQELKAPEDTAMEMVSFRALPWGDADGLIKPPRRSADRGWPGAIDGCGHRVHYKEARGRTTASDCAEPGCAADRLQRRLTPSVRLQ